MKRLLSVALAVVVCGGWGGLAFGQDEGNARNNPKGSSGQIAQMYLTFLQEEGYNPKIDQDGDVLFKYEGGNYYVDIYEDDPTFLAVVYPRFWEIENPEEHTKALVAANATNLKKKAVKVQVTDDNVSVGIEIFLSTPETFKEVFPRVLRTLKEGRDDFVKNMREG